MPKNFTQRQLIIIGAVVVVVILGFIVFLFNVRSKSGSSTTLNLNVWGTDAPKAFNDLISSYTGPGSGTNMQVKYTQISASDYQSQLLSAIAAGTGPDIFEIGNRDLPQWKSVITPLPATLATTFSLVTLQNDFPTVVGQDFVSNSQIYALPLSIDTLAMIYNKDLVDSAGIATMPKTWSEFDNDVPLLRSVDATGQLMQAAAALGGSETSIANAPDIVFLMMLQNGTQMTSSDGSSVTFADGSGSSAGVNAFNFYLQFANASSPYYTWNDSMGNAVDSFAQGKTAILFDYAASLADIKAKSPFLNIGIAPMPQPDNATVAVNYANYSGLAVNRSSANISAAWTFIINLTTSLADEKIYTKDTGTAPALRAAIQNDLTDPAMSVFAAQALTARSWYEGNSEKIDGIMNTAIQTVLNGSANSTVALSEAESQLNGNQ